MRFWIRACAMSDAAFLLPSSDLDESVSILKERSVEARGHDWIREGYDYIEHWVKDDCNHRLATLTIYTEGKSPEETRDEIVDAIHMRETRR